MHERQRQCLFSLLPVFFKHKIFLEGIGVHVGKVVSSLLGSPPFSFVSLHVPIFSPGGCYVQFSFLLQGGCTCCISCRLVLSPSLTFCGGARFPPPPPPTTTPPPAPTLLLASTPTAAGNLFSTFFSPVLVGWKTLVPALAHGGRTCCTCCICKFEKTKSLSCM